MGKVTENKNEVAAQAAAPVSFAAFQGEEIVGLDLNASDVKMPKVKLLQITSPEVAKSAGKIQAGVFYNTVTEKTSETITAVLLDQGKMMTYWKQPFKRGEEPLCKSFDGKMKTEGCGDGNCLKCQYSSQNPKAWENLEEGKTKPPCNMAYTLLAIDCATGTPFRIIITGASVSKAKDFFSKLVPLKVSPFACKVTLSSSQETNDMGTFYVVKFGDPVPNDDVLNPDGSLNVEKYKELSETSKAYKDLFMTQLVQEDVVDVDTYTEDDEENGTESNKKSDKLF